MTYIAHGNLAQGLALELFLNLELNPVIMLHCLMYWLE